ncbi:hypothetical protein HDV04_000565 [Boothiomyces sp. JEL0838]|nr:hypothetical protein HDV04_000565 [Boothiomyces sp. JEL0838]
MTFQSNPQFIAVVAEFTIAAVNMMITVPYYKKAKLTVVSYCHIAFGVILLMYQIVTMILEVNGYTTTVCAYWNIQGVLRNFTEASIDWIFTLRVFYLETKPLIKKIWIALFLVLDVFPRVVSLALYVTVKQPSGLCILIDPEISNIVKTILNIIYISIVASYFVCKMRHHMKQVTGKTEQYESLTMTSTIFAILLLLIRCVLYIPYILNLWPAETALLTPIEMCIITPLCFLNVAFGSKLKLRGKSGSGSQSPKDNSVKRAKEISWKRSSSSENKH